MPIKNVDAKTLRQWMDSGEAVIVDVREPNEHQTSAIPGATLIPLGQISLSNLPKTNGKKLVIHCMLGKRGGMACDKLLSEESDLEIYNLEGGINAWQEAGFEVATGSKESNSKPGCSPSDSSCSSDASCSSSKSGCKDSPPGKCCMKSYLTKGKESCPAMCQVCSNLGKLCCKSKMFYCLPLERQTQVVQGVMIVLGVFLGHFVSGYFYWISFFIGCGLIYAGISGICTLTSILAKMSWNKKNKPL